MNRVQLRRTKGWRMPEHTWAVTRPNYWGNPFKIGTTTNAAYGNVVVRDAAHAVELFREYLANNPLIVTDAQFVLRGWNLACWCPLDAPCHADVLLEVANG